MIQELPSLTALRAFEAAARHRSIKRAAQELHVTPSAVSQQIKLLEEALGGPLFVREPRAIDLTDPGRVLSSELTDSFRRLADTIAGLFPSERSGVLTVSVLPSFAAKWLVPRLGRLRASHPEIDVRVSASHRVVNFAEEDVDLAVRHGRGGWPGVKSELLLPGEYYPVCSPRLLEGGHPLRTPEDLRHHRLLHAEPSDWPRWLHVHGVQGVDPGRGPRFSDDGLLLDAAIDGQGVAISRDVLSASDIARGLLVAPFGRLAVQDRDFYLVYPESAMRRPAVAAFRDWIVAEARNAVQAPPARSKPRRSRR